MCINEARSFCQLELGEVMHKRKTGKTAMLTNYEITHPLCCTLNRTSYL